MKLTQDAWVFGATKHINVYRARGQGLFPMAFRTTTNTTTTTITITIGNQTEARGVWNRLKTRRSADRTGVEGTKMAVWCLVTLSILLQISEGIPFVFH